MRRCSLNKCAAARSTWPRHAREQSLTYAELDRRANAIAHALQAAGAGPETLVALFAERGLALLTMMIATLKAGAAFQALDIQQPRPPGGAAGPGRSAAVAGVRARDLGTGQRPAADAPATPPA